jgi:guanylate cyclase
MPSHTTSNRLPAVVTRVTSIGHAPTDTSSAKTRKTVSTQTAVITTVVVIPWTIFYYAIGIPQAAAIPTFYVIASLFGLWWLSLTKDDRVLRYSQLAMFLVLPALVHIALGGFANSSAVIIFGAIVAVGAMSFADVRRPGVWFALFTAIVLIMVPLDPVLRDRAPYVPPGVITTFFAVNILSTSLMTFLALAVYVRARDRLEGELADERARSDQILHNVLPGSIADRLKDGEQPIADRFDQVGVLMADIIDFTPLSEQLSADKLVAGLNSLFAAFDVAARAVGVEKVKTIGDAYMAITGAPDGEPNVAALGHLALAMREAATRTSIGRRSGITLRIGIDAGPVVAGVIGESRFLYDVYGDAVNTASRMESTAAPNTIQVTERAAALMGDAFRFSPVQPVEIKGKGIVLTRHLEARIEGDPRRQRPS